MSSIVNFSALTKHFQILSLGYLDFVSSFQCHANWHLPLGHVQQLLKLTRMMSKPKKGAPYPTHPGDVAVHSGAQAASSNWVPCEKSKVSGADSIDNQVSVDLIWLMLP